jgi:hypothetical protein
MNIFNLRTGRKKEEINVVSDLDAMIADPVPFRYLGRVHKIKPISVLEFYKYTNALANLMALKDRKDATSEDMLDAYFNLFKSVCDTITHKDIESMSTAQIAALFKLTVDSITGAAQATNEVANTEKKNSTA